MPELDNDIANRSDVFLQVGSEQVEYIEMTTIDFKNLWKLQ